MKKLFSSQAGVIHTLPLLIVVAAIGIISYLLISSTAPLGSGLLGKLFPKQPSNAAGNEIVFVDGAGNAVSQTTTPAVNIKLTSPWGAHASAVLGNAALMIYDDKLVNGWSDGSYDATISFSNTTPVFAGNNSIKFKPNKGWAGLEFNSPANTSTTGYDAIQFAVYATQPNQNLSLYAENPSFNSLGANVPLSNYGGFPPLNSWKVYKVPLSTIGAASKKVGDFTIQNNTGSAQPAVYIDQVQLVSNSAPPPSPKPTPTTIPTPSPTPTPVPLFTTSAVVAEDANFTINVKTISPFTTNPSTILYTFSNSTPGTKTAFVKFTSSSGQTQTFSKSIQLVSQSSPTPTSTPTSTPAPGGGGYNTPINGLHVSGAQILNSANNQVRMVGVNFSGSEYTCINNGGIWDVSADQNTINAMKAWHVRTVRIPINEDCWLGVNGITGTSAQNLRQAVVAFVNLLIQNNMVPIINLHFSGDGVHAAVEQEPMANRVHSLDFWTSVANTFKGNSSVVFEPYNEPHDISWGCWRDGGCSVKGTNSSDGNFVVAGIQEMVSAIRNTGATNIIIVTGVDWGADVSGWGQFKPTDSLNQLAVGWHSYGDGLSCQNLSCWNSVLGGVISSNPIVATEIGEFDCKHTYIDQVMGWLDSHQAQGYTAWTWGPFNCSKDPALITNTSGSPTQIYGQGFRDHLLTLP